MPRGGPVLRPYREATEPQPKVSSYISIDLGIPALVIGGMRAEGVTGSGAGGDLDEDDVLWADGVPVGLANEDAVHIAHIEWGHGGVRGIRAGWDLLLRSFRSILQTIPVQTSERSKDM